MKVDDATYQLLNHGEIVSCELTPAGSNYTFLAKLNLGDSSGLAIYKPKDGEIPLWDFPSGTLYKRECAAYILSDILGWDFHSLYHYSGWPVRYWIGSTVYLPRYTEKLLHVR
ncbi:MAG: hypothetical protein CM1200mP15_14320 [Dehalococcoidia bacterium]|nr:MAG: hypothetical protein CM1200mP15_14320 [Dehalococcoidia bacterium]